MFDGYEDLKEHQDNGCMYGMGNGATGENIEDCDCPEEVIWARDMITRADIATSEERDNS